VEKQEGSGQLREWDSSTKRHKGRLAREGLRSLHLPSHAEPAISIVSVAKREARREREPARLCVKAWPATIPPIESVVCE
jgi:hypothetical protein